MVKKSPGTKTKAGVGRVWFRQRQNLTRKILQFSLLSGMVVLAIQIWGVSVGILVIIGAVYLEVK